MIPNIHKGEIDIQPQEKLSYSAFFGVHDPMVLLARRSGNVEGLDHSRRSNGNTYHDNAIWLEGDTIAM